MRSSARPKKSWRTYWSAIQLPWKPGGSWPAGERVPQVPAKLGVGIDMPVPFVMTRTGLSCANRPCKARRFRLLQKLPKIEQYPYAGMCRRCGS
jgi:hypothetical protein